MSCRLSLYFRKTCFLPCWSFVSFGIWWNVWGCVCDWNKSSRKGRTGKKKIAEYICPHVTCTELNVTSWQNQAVSRYQNVSHWKLWVYKINPCHVIDSKHIVYLAQYKIKGVNVVGSINHVTFLTNRFMKLISLLTSTIFISGNVN